MSSALDHIYTPRSCRLPGTVLSSKNATRSVTTMFNDRSPFIAKSNWFPSKKKKQVSSYNHNEKKLSRVQFSHRKLIQNDVEEILVWNRTHKSPIFVWKFCVNEIWLYTSFSVTVFLCQFLRRLFCSTSLFSFHKGTWVNWLPFYEAIS